jgi:pilus assembly protein CpaC
MMKTATSLVTAVALAAAVSFPTAVRAAGQAAPQDQGAPAVPRIGLTAGRSTVLMTDFDVTRIAVTNPAVADAVVVAPREVLIDGKAPGTVSLILWGADRRLQYDVAVDPPVTTLQQQLRALFPGEDIQVSVSDEATILSGHVSNNLVMLRAAEIAAKTSGKTKVINLLQVPGGIESQQVMLQVRFAEVNRNALTELGVSLFTGPAGYKDFVGRVTAGTGAPAFTGVLGDAGGTLTFGDFLNLFLFNTKYNVGGLLKALQTKGFLQSLAEPNLIAYNGQEASFLAGGEIPVPVVQGGAIGTVSILYKEFGIRLNFTPTIAGDTIRLKVRPEVSTLDFANGVVLGGFRIPALQTRRAETEIELRDGQSFAIAGLLDNISQDTRSAIPLLSSLPIIGYLFKTKAESQNRTELMVLITPHLVRPLDPDEVPPLPTLGNRFLPAIGAGEELQGGGGAVDAPSVPAVPAPGQKK